MHLTLNEGEWEWKIDTWENILDKRMKFKTLENKPLKIQIKIVQIVLVLFASLAFFCLFLCFFAFYLRLSLQKLCTFSPCSRISQNLMLF